MAANSASVLRIATSVPACYNTRDSAKPHKPQADPRP
jgi:hypothetical protein